MNYNIAWAIRMREVRRALFDAGSWVKLGHQPVDFITDTVMTFDLKSTRGGQGLMSESITTNRCKWNA